MSASIASDPGQVSSAALDAMESKIDQLPLLPQVLVRILQISSADDDYFDQIDELARRDPPFAVRLVAMANSASSSPVSPIETIKDALTRVGATVITNLVASLAVQRVLVPSAPSQVALWQHSIRVAVAAETIAALVPALKVDKGHAYLGGLLHDIGRFVMLEHASDNLLKVDESHWHSPEELIEADVEIFKFTHSELGYLACSHWGLPGNLANTVRRHHEKLSGSIQPGSVEANVLCVEIADRVDMFLLERNEVDRLSSDELVETIDQKCLWSPEAKNLVKAEILATRIDEIATQSARLFGGLALA
jgi:putative nucleotidyltransferase with HDIG domain